MSSKSTNLPMVFRGKGSYTSSDHPEFGETVKAVQSLEDDEECSTEISTYPVLPLHALQQVHVNGRQNPSEAPRATHSFHPSHLPSHHFSVSGMCQYVAEGALGP